MIITDNLISFARWEVGLCILIRLALSDRHNAYMLSCQGLYLFNRVEYISPRRERCAVEKHSDTHYIDRKLSILSSFDCTNKILKKI